MTRAGHPNRGPARKYLPGCPLRASKSRAATLHLRTQHSACAGQHRWRQDTEKNPKDASWRTPEGRKRGAGEGDKHKSSANLGAFSAVIIPGEKEKEKKLVFVCMFLSTLHTFRLCIPSNSHELFVVVVLLRCSQKFILKCDRSDKR